MSASAAPHRVRRLALAVQGARDAQAALAWRRALYEGLDGAWRAALDGALDAAAAHVGLGNRTWRLPRLHLRLRAREPQALADALRAAIDEALARQLSPPAPAPALQSEAERAATAFAVFLATGRLPWHDDEADAGAVARALRAAAQDALGAALTADTWPEAWLERASEGGASPLLQRWATLLDATATARLRTALASVGAAASTVDAPPEAPRANEAALGLWRWWSLGRLRARPVDAALSTRAAASPRAAAAAAAAATTQRPAARGDAPTAPAPRDGSTGGEAVANAEATAAATWWAHDAGLVLLHPYLPTLLRATGCAVDDALIPAQLPRAAALLHALVTGRDEAFEFELTLAKLLLGLAPGAPLPPGPLAIDAAARAEADALLDAAIGHWPALGGTGVEAFRASFLAREGSLAQRDDGWHLRVADEPFDVLLGRLPWGIGLVRLPWMDAPLRVHWGAWGA
ncbi:MAG TPA: contractile injection system tape measure protein [Burkholderiaceae bacterium]|nr:contractile injection system tape measure protein [Burkholderiaceae bacterium]